MPDDEQAPPAAEAAATPAPGQDAPRSAAEPDAAQPPAARPRRRESGRARQRRQKKGEETDSPLYRLKIEGAQALGLWEKVQQVGWGGLSAAESGRVGGYMTRVLRMQRASSERRQAGV